MVSACFCAWVFVAARVSALVWPGARRCAPRGLPWVGVASATESRGEYTVSDLDEASRTLTSLRFGPSLARDPLEKLRFAMMLYARLHNSSWLEVPGDFVVPDDWPEPVRGLALGQAVGALRRLEAAALVGSKRARSKTSPESGMEVNRDLGAPRPSKTRWGRLLTESTGFDWDARPTGDGAFLALLSALRCFVDDFGDCVIPRGFRVPNRPPYPPELAGARPAPLLLQRSFNTRHRGAPSPPRCGFGPRGLLPLVLPDARRRPCGKAADAAGPRVETKILSQRPRTRMDLQTKRIQTS